MAGRRDLGGERVTIKLDYGPRGAAVRRIRLAVLMLLGVTVVGTIGYMVLLGWSLLDALYMTVITVGTVGYGEAPDLSSDWVQRVWSMTLIIGGVAVLGYATTSLVALAVEGTIRGYFRERRMRAEIDRLDDHYILCGYGRVGSEVAREFVSERVPFVVIEQDPAKVEDCLRDGHLAVVGVASEDELLIQVGIGRANGLVAAVDSDADNVFVVLSARKLNPRLHIVARASSDESAAKIEMAGADRTISPYAVGGRRLASLATQPLIVDFLDVVTRGEKGIEFRLEEFAVPSDSPLADQTIGELDIGGRTGARVLAIRSESGDFDTTPAAHDKIFAGDTLVVLGSREQVDRLEKLMRGDKLPDEAPRVQP